MSRKHRKGHEDESQTPDAHVSAASWAAHDHDAAFEGPVEKPAARRSRLSAKAHCDKRSAVIDRSGLVGPLERAAKKLKRAPASERILRVPQWDMDLAVEAMRKAGVDGVVTNLCGSRRLWVEPRGR